MTSVTTNRVRPGGLSGASIDQFEALFDVEAKFERAREELVRSENELARIDDERHQLTQSLVHLLAEAPAKTREYWQKMVRLPPEEVQQWRTAILADFARLLDVVCHTSASATQLARLGRPVAGADDLPAVETDLASFRDRVLSRWNTLDDLHQLIVDTIELPEWVLNGPTPAHLRPPQSWWEAEDDDPFQPLPDQP